MTEQRHLAVVVYDIGSDRRRTRLHKALCNFGTPVQYSVFECLVDVKELDHMRDQIQRIVKPRKDHVRIYHLCAACYRKTEVTAGPPVADNEDAIIV